jgi:ankyrin repeat protein
MQINLVVNQTLESSINEFIWAARNGPDNLKKSYRMVEIMLISGIPVDGFRSTNIDVAMRSSERPSPLHGACHFGHIDIAELLIKNGADMDLLLMTNGLSMLCIAAGGFETGKRHLDLVKLLLDNGADVNQCMPGGCTVLHSDYFPFDQEILDTILAAGADINARTDTNDTPLHSAAKDGDIERVEFFLKNGAHLDALNDDGLTAIEVVQSVIDNYDYGSDTVSDSVDSVSDSSEDAGLDSGNSENDSGSEDAGSEDAENDSGNETGSDDNGLSDSYDEVFAWYEIINLIEDEQKRRMEGLRQQQCLAFMMGQHDRLGEASVISKLDGDAVRMVLQWV